MPNYSDSDLMGAIGVSHVENVVLTELRWIFRPQPFHDKGVDAHVELSLHKESTGRLIGLQIKSGQSYFREKTSSSIVYRGDTDHLDYWRLHTLPIVIVLYDPDEKAAFWQFVCTENVKETGVGWMIEVPLSNRLSAKTADAWAEIAMPEPERLKRLNMIGFRLESRYTNRLGLLYQVTSLAKYRVDICSPFLSRELIESIGRNSGSSVQIRCLTGINQPDDLISGLNDLQRCGKLRLRFAQNIHEKMFIVDGGFMFTTSANLTKGGWSAENLEQFSCSTDSKLIGSNEERFDEIWEGRSELFTIDDYRKAGR